MTYDKNNIFALVGASSEVAVNPYYEDGKLKRPLELLDITFTIIFAKPMEPSHIAIQTIDDAANYQLVYFEDALSIKEAIKENDIDKAVEILKLVLKNKPEKNKWADGEEGSETSMRAFYETGG